MVKEEWVLRFNEKFMIPIRETVLVLIACALFADAFNNGLLFSSNVVAHSAYMCDQGIWDPSQGVWQKCYLHAEGTRLTYNCENKTGTGVNGQDSPYGNLSFISQYR
jgi:hypothetical protein